jgi:hypothetical protein
MAVIHDVVDVLNGDVRAELLLEPVAYQVQRLAEAGCRRPVAAHANLDWSGHFLSLFTRMIFSENRLPLFGIMRCSTFYTDAARSGQAAPV